MPGIGPGPVIEWLTDVLARTGQDDVVFPGNVTITELLTALNGLTVVAGDFEITAGDLIMGATTVTETKIAKIVNNGLIEIDRVSVDASGGGVAQTTNLTLLPANSILLFVLAVVATPFDGDTTQTLEVGVSGNEDAYIDTLDFDPAAVADTYFVSDNPAGNNDQQTKQWITAPTQLIATWTNDANANAGQVFVYVAYANMG